MINPFVKNKCVYLGEKIKIDSYALMFLVFVQYIDV